MKFNLPVLLSVIFFIIYQLIFKLFKIDNGEFSILRAIGAGGSVVLGYIIGKAINSRIKK
jgi:hypothetical protein